MPEDHAVSAARRARVVSGPRLGLPPHDHRIFSVVSVVTTSDAAGDEAEALVEADRGEIRDAHLERVATLGVVARDLEQASQHRRGDPEPPVLGIDGDVHHVPGVDVAGQHEVADESLVGVDGRDRERALLGQLAGEHRARPRRRVRGPLDLLDRVEVGELEPPQREAHAGPTASHRARGRRPARRRRPGRRSVASEACSDARGTWSSESSGGTSAPRAVEKLAVAAGAVADAERSRREDDVLGRTASGPGTNTSPRRASMTGKAPLVGSGERVERRDAGHREIEREREAARDGEADPRAGEAAGPGSDDDRGEIGGRRRRAASRSASTSARSACGRVVRSPRVSPSATSALVARSVAVSNARISTREIF